MLHHRASTSLIATAALAAGLVAVPAWAEPEAMPPAEILDGTDPSVREGDEARPSGTDAALVQEAHRQLESKLDDSSRVEVSSEGGIVTLTGEVDSAEDKARAEEIVNDIGGVDRIQNDIRVLSEPPIG
jgi:hypothetical protein